MDVDKIDLSEKEKLLFYFAIKAQADPRSFGDEDFSRLREVGVTETEIVHVIELVNFGDSVDRFCVILGIGWEAAIGD